MKKLFAILLFLNFLVVKNSVAQTINPSRWSFTAEDLGGGQFNIMISCYMDDGWHIFSQDYVGISVPASLTLEKNDAFEVVGKMQEQGELIKEEIDLGGEKEISMYYKHRVVFVQTIKLLKQNAVIKGGIEYMLCKEVCVPPSTYEFEIKLPL